MFSRISVLISASLLVVASAHGQTILFHDDFENGLSNWTTQTPWHLADASTSSCLGAWSPLPSGHHCAWYGDESLCNFDVPVYDSTSLMLASAIALPLDAPSIVLEVQTASEAEDNGWDSRLIQVSANGGDFQQVENVRSSSWRMRTIDLSQYAGQSIRLGFTFWAGDGAANSTIGWLVDDVTIRTDSGSFTAGCTGDGFTTVCPCANNGAPGHGCANSFNSSGALLVGNGTNSISADTTSLTVTGVSNTTVTFVQRRVVAPLAINLYSDGLLCGSNPTVRIGSVAAAANTATYPQPGQLPVSVRGVVTPLSARSYQVVYRNPPAFCTSGTFNVSNSVTTTWKP